MDKNILFLLNISMEGNGPSVHLLNDVIKETLNRGVFVDVVYLKDNSHSTKLIEHPNIRYIPIIINEQKKNNFFKRFLNEIIYAKKCKKIFKKKRYDSVFVQSNNVPFVYAKFLSSKRVRTIYNAQDLFPQNWNYINESLIKRLLYKPFLKLQRKGLNAFDNIITISPDMKNTLENNGISGDKIFSIFNWSYSDNLISKESIDRTNYYDLNASKNKFNILYAGNIGKMQNIQSIISAAKLAVNDPFHFYIIGNGSSLNEIKKGLSDFKNISFLPMQKSNYSESIYSQADLIIISLFQNIILTALPSKTATCMRTQKPILFAIGADSKFENCVDECEKVFFSECDEHSIYGKIKHIFLNKVEISDNSSVKKRLEFISQHMSSVKNPKRYVDILLKEEE